MAKKITDLKKELEKKNKQAKNDSAMHMTLDPNGPLLGGESGEFAMESAEDTLGFVEMHLSILKTALLIAYNVVKKTWPKLNPGKFTVNKLSIIDFIDMDLGNPAPVFYAGYIAEDGSEYVICGHWQPYEEEQNPNSAGGVCFLRKAKTIENGETHYWDYGNQLKRREISREEYQGCPDVLIADEESDDYGLREFATMMRDTYTETTGEPLTAETYENEKNTKQTQGTIRLLNKLADYNIETEICDVYVDGQMQYGVKSIFPEAQFVTTYLSDNCYPISYFVEEDDTIVPAFTAGSDKEVAAFWNFAAKVQRCMTVESYCYPLSSEVIEVYNDKTETYEQKYNRKKKELTDEEIFTAQLIHAMQWENRNRD